MTDVYDIQLPDGRIVGIQASSPQEAAQGARNVLAREQGQKDAANKSDATAQAFGQGATLGFGDELAAATRAAAPGFSNWMMQQPAHAFGQRPDAQGFVEPTQGPQQTVSTAPTFQGRYDEELARERAKAAQFKKDEPVLAHGANIAGNIATTALALPASVTAAAPTFIGNAVKMGLTGAGLGGVQGFGEGEGGAEKRATSALLGGGIGGVTGVAIPAAGVLGRAAMESAPGRWVAQNITGPVAQRVAAIFEGAPTRSLSAAAPDGTQGVMGPLTQASEAIANPAQAGAIERLAVAAQRSGLSHEQFLRRLDQLGPEAMLADLDQQFLSAARMAHTMPGQTKTLAPNVLEARDRQAGGRLVTAFEGAEPPPSSFALRGEGQAFDQNLRAVGNRAYGDMRDAGLRQTPELIEIQSNPIVSRAIDTVMNVERQTRQGTNRLPASPVEIMHKVKQAIWDMGFDAATARPGPNASFFRDLGVEYMNRLKRANPALAEADQAYAQAASLPDFFDAGRSFLSRGSSEKATNSSAPALADLLTGADPQQVLAARAGSTNAAREVALEGTDQARALAKRLDQSGPVQAKLAELYGTDRSGSILRQAAAEQQFARTSNEILRGSKTADKLAEALMDGGGGVGSPASLLQEGIRPNVLVRLLQGVNTLADRANEPVRNRIGQMTLRPDPEENRRILQAIADELTRRGRGAPIRAGLAVGASGAAQ